MKTGNYCEYCEIPVPMQGRPICFLSRNNGTSNLDRSGMCSVDVIQHWSSYVTSTIFCIVHNIE